MLSKKNVSMLDYDLFSRTVNYDYLLKYCIIML